MPRNCPACPAIPTSSAALLDPFVEEFPPKLRDGGKEKSLWSITDCERLTQNEMGMGRHTCG